MTLVGRGVGDGVAEGVMTMNGLSVAVGHLESVASEVGATVGVTCGRARLQALMTNARISRASPRPLTTVIMANSFGRYPFSKSSSSIPTCASFSWPYQRLMTSPAALASAYCVLSVMPSCVLVSFSVGSSQSSMTNSICPAKRSASPFTMGVLRRQAGHQEA